MYRRGFTVIELLVSISIIAFLAALLFPIIASAKRKAYDTTCLSNMRQIGMAFGMYLDSYDERMPPRLSTLYPSYIPDATILRCPHDPFQGQTHDTNGRLEGGKFLPSGVSYTWVPNWDRATSWGWWNPWPDHGFGKWFGETPISECHWQWATFYGQFENGDQVQRARFPAHLLLFNGTVMKWPARKSVEFYMADP